MLARELIEKLEKLIENHESVKDMMGECEIHIDKFGKTLGRDNFVYMGVSPDIEIERSADGVYNILVEPNKE